MDSARLLLPHCGVLLKCHICNGGSLSSFMCRNLFDVPQGMDLTGLVSSITGRQTLPSQSVNPHFFWWGGGPGYGI